MEFLLELCMKKENFPGRYDSGEGQVCIKPGWFFLNLCYIPSIQTCSVFPSKMYLLMILKLSFYCLKNDYTWRRETLPDRWHVTPLCRTYVHIDLTWRWLSASEGIASRWTFFWTAVGVKLNGCTLILNIYLLVFVSVNSCTFLTWFSFVSKSYACKGSFQFWPQGIVRNYKPESHILKSGVFVYEV